ncbi:MAG: tetratricopeptide repeat protein [Deltaproteobacteria bacterium]|nr:tetratricopeptide repeat protein [Deltaproteobacteria bacterium]
MRDSHIPSGRNGVPPLPVDVRRTDPTHPCQKLRGLEAELAASEREGVGEESLAALHLKLAKVWAEELSRLDRALFHYQRTWELAKGSDDAQAARAAAREIRRSLGDEAAVVKLYENELASMDERTAPAEARCAVLRSLGQVLLASSPGEGITCLEQALELMPRDEAAMTMLAEACAARAFSMGNEPSYRERAVNLFLALAGLKWAEDRDASIALMRRALGVDPTSARAADDLERALGEVERWDLLDQHFRQRLVFVEEPDEARALMLKRSRLLLEKLGNRGEAKQLLEQLSRAEPADGPATQALIELCREDGDFALLRELGERKLGEPELSAVSRIEIFLELSTISRDKLRDRDRAAEYLHQILSIDPFHSEAHERYAAHFREKRDWRGLSELAQFSAVAAEEAELPAAEVARRYEELAEVNEQRLGDVEQALLAWQKVAELSPGYRKATEAIRRLGARARMWESLIGVLEKEAAAAVTPQEKGEAMRRIAQVYRERQFDPRRAVALYEQALEHLPGDSASLRSLAELYEREGDDAGLARTLRRQLDSEVLRLASEGGGEQAPRDWPTAIRAERLTTLRRLAAMYETRLNDVEGVVYSTTAILELLPGDREALERLERVLEKARDVDQLERTLVYHAESAPGPAERARALRRLAQLAEQGGDLVEAIFRWERLLKVSPNDQEALLALQSLYEQGGRFAELVPVLERLLALRSQAQPGPECIATRAADLKRLAWILDQKLDKPEQAIRAYEQVLSLLPRDRDAISALGRLYEQRQDWRGLADLFGRQAMLLALEDRAAAAELALRRARLLEERLSAPREAARVLEQLQGDIAPGHLQAMRCLRALHVSTGDFIAALKDAEREFLIVDQAARLPLAIEIATLCEEHLRDPFRAIQAYERVLALSPGHPAAMTRLVELFLQVGDFRQHALFLDKLSSRAPAGAARQALLLRLARVHEEHLNEPRKAFQVLFQAHEEGPGKATLELLRRVAVVNHLFRELSVVYEGERRRARALGPAAHVAACMQHARLLESHLGDRRGALAVVSEAVRSLPEDDLLLQEAERMAQEEMAREAWKLLLSIYESAMERPGGEARALLYEKRARVLEEQMCDPGGALDELLKAFALLPGREPTQEEIKRLAALTERWEDAVWVEETLYTRAREAEARVQVARRAATLVEEKLDDPLRAFRGYLRVLTLSPGDEDVHRQLWRLAEKVGQKAQMARQVSPPPPPEVVVAPVENTRADSTIPLTLADLGEAESDGARFKSAWEELAFAYESLPAADVTTRVRNLFRAADAWERGEGDVEKALRSLSQALDAAPFDDSVAERLERVADEHNAWEELAILYQGAAERARSPEHAAKYLGQVAKVRVRQNRPDDAEALYRQVLGILPDDTLTREKLDTLYRDTGRLADLAASLEERTDPRLGAAVPEAHRLALLRDLAALYDDKLGKPYDAITALERLIHLCPEDLSALEQLASLYSRIGRFGQAAHVLTRVADLADGSPRGREARRRLAEIYEKDLERPDRAIEAYQALLVSQPEDKTASDALEALLNQSGRWKDLSELLRKRAHATQDPAARAQVLKKRAEVLEFKLSRPDEALGCLRSASGLLPGDPGITSALIDALVKVGRLRDAATLLEGQLQDLAAHGRLPDESIPLWLRLAEIMAGGLSDRDGARRTVGKVLALAPEHPGALAILSRLARDADDPRAYADARLREAEAATDDAVRAAALLEAARTLSDRVGEPAMAAEALEKLLAIDPCHAEATWSLASILADNGEKLAASRLLERRLLADMPLEERVRVLTRLAELQRGDAASLARLDEALTAKPDHVPAVLAKADHLREAGRYEDLEAFLGEAIPRLEEERAEVRAELNLRLAQAYEALAQDEEAHARLMHADKLVRNDFRTKLALGLNRFRAQKWREAALHLSVLAEHPEAPAHASETAEASCLAAAAEIRALRPERAPALYEVALRLAPSQPVALQKLAEIEMERGHVRRAAELTERHAATIEEPAARMRAFENLGDLVSSALKDEQWARECYRAAAGVGLVFDGKHSQFLEKLLAHEQAAFDHDRAACWAEKLATIAENARARASWLLVAAAEYQKAEDLVRARAMAEDVLEISPASEDAVWIASEVALAQGDHEAAASLLGRALAAWDLRDKEEHGSERRAELWRRLGVARRGRGDQRGAIMALERAVAMAPECPCGVYARRDLVALLAQRPDQADALRLHLRLLVDAEQRPDEVLALGRALATETAAGPVDEDGGRATLELAAALGETLSDSDRAYLARHPARILAADEAYSGALEESDRAALIAEEHDSPLAGILEALWEAAPLLWPDPGRALAALGMSSAERVSPVDAGAATAIYPQVVKALDAAATVLYQNRTPMAPDIALACAQPPVVVLGPRLLVTAAASGARVDLASDAEFRFLLGRAAELARPERIPAVGLPLRALSRLCAGLALAFGGTKELCVDDVDPEDAAAEAERLRQVLPLMVRKRLESLLDGIPQGGIDPARYHAACMRAADRAGLLACGDVVVAMGLVGGPEKGKHLVRLAVKERYLAVRARLGVGTR